MCGIAGRILNAPGNVGHDLVEMMDAQAHRGADFDRVRGVRADA